LIAQYIETVQPSVITQGMGSIDVKKAGVRIERVFKQNYYFYTSHSANIKEKTRSLRVWGYRTNNLNRALDWFKNGKQWWNKNDGARALWIKVGGYPQLVATAKGGSYVDKAFNSGQMMNFMANTLDSSCLKKFAKADDLEISNIPDKAAWFRWRKGHSSFNYNAWRQYVTSEKRNSVLLRPYNKTHKLWSNYSADIRNANEGWKEAYGRFLMKYCP